MSFWDSIQNFIGQHGNTIASAGSVYGALDAADEIRGLGNAQQQYLTDLGNQLNTDSGFQGYGVTTNLGQTNVGTDGSITGAGLGPTGMWNAGNSALSNGSTMLQGAAGVTGGQSAMDWNGAAQNAMGQGGGVNPNHGYFGQQSQALSNQAGTLNPSHGYFGQQSQAVANQASALSPNHGQFGQAAQTARDLSLADPSQRQSEIFNQIMAIQNPELNRQQASQMAQEHAMGRGGVMGSQYGGTSGDAAMARARTQAGNEAAISAMQQADAERKMFGDMASQYGQVGNQNYANMSNQQSALNNAASQFGQIGNQNYANISNQQSALNNAASQFGQIGNQNYSIMADRENALNQFGTQLGQLGNQTNANATDKMGMLGQLGSSLGQLGIDQSQLSYLPMEMQMKLLDMGRTNAELAQSGQHTGLGYLAQLGLGGSTANLNAQQIGSQMTGNLYNSLLSNTGGATSADGSVSGLGGLLSGGMDLLSSLFGGDD